MNTYTLTLMDGDRIIEEQQIVGSLSKAHYGLAAMAMTMEPGWTLSLRQKPRS